jgi:hypothetical protein
MQKRKLDQQINAINKDVQKHIIKKYKQICKSGCLDIDGAPDDYSLAKCIMNAIAKDLEWQFRPLTKENRKLANNIYLFT